MLQAFFSALLKVLLDAYRIWKGQEERVQAAEQKVKDDVRNADLKASLDARERADAVPRELRPNADGSPAPRRGRRE